MATWKISLERQTGLYLKDAGHKGRGVFCKKDIRKGAVLEITPGLVLNDTATTDVDKTLLINYTFAIGAVSKKLRQRKKIRQTDNCSAVIMGIASFCNHSDDPNAEIEWEEHNGTLYYTLTALKAIPRHTEICTSYGDGWLKDRHIK